MNIEELMKIKAETAGTKLQRYETVGDYVKAVESNKIALKNLQSYVTPAQHLSPRRKACIRLAIAILTYKKLIGMTEQVLKELVD